jgi:hypothetical protein
MVRGYGSAVVRTRTKSRSNGGPPPAIAVERSSAVVAGRSPLDRFYLAVPVFCFLISTLILGYVSPGMQYDEAIFESAAVRLLAHPKRLPPSRQATLEIGGVHFPLMVLPYAGAMKDYLLIVPFALFGTQAPVGRAVAAVLGALGVAGFTFFLRRFVSAGWAVAGGVAVAVHPGWIHWILYDNGNLAFWMFSVGFVLAALWWYIERRTTGSAFLFGFAVGVAVWGRANFLWPLAAALVATAIVRPSLLRELIRSAAPISWGGIIGGLPLLIYEFKSGLGTLAFMSSSKDPRPLSALFSRRLVLLLDSALFDSDRRGIWGGPPVPGWQSWFVVTLIVAGVISCLVLRGNPRQTALRRICALTLVMVLAITLTSRLTISAHHIVPYTPLAALVIILAAHAVALRWPVTRPAFWGAGALFLTLAMLWNVRSGVGLRKTGGVGFWSDSINAVAARIGNERDVKALDWGFASSLYVLSRGQITARELFWSATDLGPTPSLSWFDEITGGGTYLLHSPERTTQRFGATTRGFLTAVGGRAVETVLIREKSGADYAILHKVAGTESVVTQSEGPRILWAQPNPIQVCDGTGLGVAQISWATPVAAVELRVGSSTGTLFTIGSGSGTARTDKWVADGTTFFLLQRDAQKPAPDTLATLTVRVSERGCN